jgi:hypothetical protein
MYNTLICTTWQNACVHICISSIEPCWEGDGGDCLGDWINLKAHECYFLIKLMIVCHHLNPCALRMANIGERAQLGAFLIKTSLAATAWGITHWRPLRAAGLGAAGTLSVVLGYQQDFEPVHALGARR